MDQNRDLHILWTSGDPLTARLMVLMYAANSLLNGWWDSVTVILWGAGAKLAAMDQDVQETIKTAAGVGVKFSACEACARQLGVQDKLEGMGIEVKYWGEPLTGLLQEKANLLTV